MKNRAALVPPLPRREKIVTSGEKSTLRGMRLEDARLDHVDLSHADLSGARFSRVGFSGCDLRSANLNRAWFVGCDLTEADLAGVLLGNNCFFDSCLAGAAGLTTKQRDYVISRGGSFRRRGRAANALRVPGPRRKEA